MCVYVYLFPCTNIHGKIEGRLGIYQKKSGRIQLYIFDAHFSFACSFTLADIVAHVFIRRIICTRRQHTAF